MSTQRDVCLYVTVLSRVPCAGVLSSTSLSEGRVLGIALEAGKAMGAHVPRSGDEVRSLRLPGSMPGSSSPGTWHSRLLDDLPQQPLLIIFLRFYLFIHERERERERERGRARRGTRSQVSRIRPWAECGAKPLSHPGCLSLLKSHHLRPGSEVAFSVRHLPFHPGACLPTAL